MNKAAKSACRRRLSLQGVGVLLWSLSGSAPAIASGLPPDFTAHYVIKKGFIDLGVARRTLRHDAGDSWIYESETKSTGGLLGALLKFNEIKRSQITFRDDRLVVQTYSHKREGINRTALNQLYAWDANKVTTTWDDGEVVSYDLVPNAYDQNMYQLSLMRDLAKGAVAMEYRLAENRRIKTYQIQVMRREKIKSAIGEYDTLVVVNRDGKAETMMWCAEALSYLPLRIEYEDNGIRINAEISGLDGMGR